ncbi:MAG TPA: DNA-directed RNA polymerase subunit alpha C-terminal domain-containing protein [Chloroflexota bacterium]|nr:DNA-directed RNA polymerase subunit alpha C-terminal domain-containing protein [Chloroflexota bacterium]
MNGVQDISGETKREVRNRLLWAIRQWQRYFRRRVVQALHSQPSSSATETTHPVLEPESAELTSQNTPFQNEQTNFPIADDVYALLFPLQTGEEPHAHIRIEALALSGRTYNALIRSQVTTVGQLASFTPEQLLQIDGIGTLTAGEIAEKLAHYTKSRSERVISEPLLGDLPAIGSLANTPLDVLDLPKRTDRLLKLSAITTVGQLTALTRMQFEKLAGVSHLSHKNIEEILAKVTEYLVLSDHEIEEAGYSLAHWQSLAPAPENVRLKSDASQIEPSLPELSPIMPDYSPENFSIPDIDTSVDQLGLFSIRVKNALVRRGVITLRLLLMHTPEMLRHIKNLGEKGLTEIQQVIGQFGWTLPGAAEVKQVALTRLLAAAFYKSESSISLADLTAAVNRHSQSMVWDEQSVAQGAANHPYIVTTVDGRYQFQLRPIDISPFPSSEEQADTLPEPVTAVIEPDVTIPYLLVSQRALDELLERTEIFSRRVTNALVRRGIITPRLLLMHTPELLLQEISNLGTKSLAEIEGVLAGKGWELAKETHVRRVTLYRLLAAAFYKFNQLIELSALTDMVNRHSQSIIWTEAEVGQGAVEHPYFVEIENGRYLFSVHPVNMSLDLATESKADSSVLPADLETSDGKLLLAKVWDHWIAILNQRQLEVLFLRYGVLGDEALTLAETGNQLGVTRERVRQIETRALATLAAIKQRPYFQPLYQLLAEGIQQAGGLLTSRQWEHQLDEKTVWEAEQARPWLLPFLCAVFEDYHYHHNYQAATQATIKNEYLKQLDAIFKRILRPHKSGGLTAGQLITATQQEWPSSFPSEMREPSFILAAIDLVERIGLVADGRYLYLRNEKKPLHPRADSGWAGRPGTHLHEWELRLRSQFEKAAGIGQLALSEAEFATDNPEMESSLPEPTEPLPDVHERTFAAPDTEGSLEQDVIVNGRNQFPLAVTEPLTSDSAHPINAPLEFPAEIKPRSSFFSTDLRQQKQRRHTKVDSGWIGRPGTRLHEWELRLRSQFAEVAWVGQISLSETEFAELCHAIQTEAQKRPNRVPSAVFMTTLVFAARYSQQNADEFWLPYLRTVWNVEYTQAFMARCRKRFMEVVPYLEQNFDFDFPRQSEGDLVAAVYRHALLPRYVQDDLARWLQEQWRAILLMADTPDLLIAELRQDKKLDYLPQRLQRFIRDKTTEAAAVALISNMAAAISLHVNNGESIETISALLADIPIEQELWREIAQIFADAAQNQPASLRQTKPRITWVWDLANEEMALRVQNIILPADSDLEGGPNRLVWLEAADANPLNAEIEVELSPWRMQTGERVINDVFLAEPDGPRHGQLVLLTDMDEEAARLDVPPMPAAKIQFFRLTQQGAYGIPVEPPQVTDGAWLVCAARPLTFLYDDKIELEPEALLDVPYPLNQHFRWAAQVTLNLPVTVKTENAAVLNLTVGSAPPLLGRPSIIGAHPIAGLSRQVQPTFANSQISLVLAQARERLVKQASLWLRGQDGWRWQRPLAELVAEGHAEWQEADLYIHLQHVIPTGPGFYLAELRASLQPLLPAPLQFAVVPGLEVAPPPDNQLYTPANPPQLVLQGVDESVLVRHDGVQVAKLPDGRHQITWHDLRHEPHLTLRFDKVDIPLAWSLPHFMAWIEPKPARQFLTLAELQDSVLHATGTKTAVSEFRLFIPGQRYRSFSLRNGRYTTAIGHSQLYDMVKLAQTKPAEVKVQVGEQSWTLLEVRRRPELTAARLEYNNQEHVLHFYTGLTEAWVGDGRFIAESLTNPFAPPVELGRANSLQAHHRLPAPTLAEDVYLLRLKLDGVEVPLAENAMRFTIGSPTKPRAQTAPLMQEIRSGQLIPAHQAEDFVLLWAENAEKGTTELTATTLYQLATVLAVALENFDFPHLRRLWPPLEKLKAVQDGSQWVTGYGYLPAWILLDKTIILRTEGQGYQLRVYPLQAAYGGREGKGYGRWRMSTAEGAPKQHVLVQWRAVTETQVQVEAGLIPDGTAVDWMEIDLLDTYALWYCARCGRLVGAQVYTLPDELQHEHLHGHPQPILRDITVSRSLGGHHLLAELLPERRGPSLMETYAELGIKINPAAAYLPEPTVTDAFDFDGNTRRTQLLSILRETKRFGTENTNQPYWASAARLLGEWRHQHSVSEFGQTIFALSTLLRAAALRPKQFSRLIKDASLSERDVQELLAELNQKAPEHLQWGLTWAELLMVHSSWLSSRTGGG